METSLHRIKEIRERVGVSRNKLQKLTGLCYQTLWRIEKGGDLRISTLKIIAEALRVDAKDLL